MTVIQQSELVRNQQSFLCKVETGLATIDAMKTSIRSVKTDDMFKVWKESLPRLQSLSCKRRNCRKCGRKGHFQRACRSKRTLCIKEAFDQPDNTLYLEMASDQQEPWSGGLSLNAQSLTFCINTGEEVTVIPENIYIRIGSPKLESVDKALKRS